MNFGKPGPFILNQYFITKFDISADISNLPNSANTAKLVNFWWTLKIRLQNFKFS